MNLTAAQIRRNLKDLEAFAAQYGWTVVYSDKKEDYFQNNTIFLNKRHTPENLYYMFLHEIGHAWLQQCDYSYESRYAELAKRKRYSTLTYRISHLQDEFEAWDTGVKIARELNMRINESKLERLRSHCLKTHILWTVKSLTTNQKKKKTI